MSEHLTEEQIQNYRSRRASPEELRTAEIHIAECAACGQRLMESETKEAVIASVPALMNPTPRHLEYEQLERYVDETLSAEERAVIAAHLESCNRCREDMERLRTYSPALKHDARAQAPAASTERQATSRGLSPLFVWALPSSLAGAVAAALLLWVGVARPLQLQVAQLVQDVHTNSSQAVREATLARDRAIQERDDARRLLKTAEEQNTRLIAQNNSLESGKERVVARNQSLTAENQKLIAQLQTTEQQIAAAQNSVGGLPADQTERMAVVQTHETGRATRTIARNLTEGLGPLLRGFGPTQPVGTAVLSRTPELLWNRHTQAAAYAVVISTLSGQRVTGTPHPIRETSWQVEPPLERGQTYTWRVTPLDASGREIRVERHPNPRFEVVDSKAAERFLEAQLQLAVLYAENRLYDKAEATLTEVAQADESAAIGQKARQLLADLRQKRQNAR